MTPAPRKFASLFFAALLSTGSLFAERPLLSPERFHHYFTEFEQQEREVTGTVGIDSWQWMLANIPWFDCSDPQFQEMYYFRWYAWQKHVVTTRRGFVVTEWLPKPQMPDGFYGALPDAAPFHLSEARWLRNSRIAEDDARFWLSPDARPKEYSFPVAAAVRSVAAVTGGVSFDQDLLPAMIANYRSWEATNQDSNGLFWSIDTRDAMEKSISGDGYRPTLNSYMYSDATAIADTARAVGNGTVADEFQAKADKLHSLIEARLWNPADQFYEVVSPAADSGIRLQKKFVDPGTVLRFSGVRELIGYIPWEYGIPAPPHAIAWKQLFNAEGFSGKYGPTTAERRSPRFRFPTSDQCTWNGPSWPYATTQTLLALAELLNTQQQPWIDEHGYYRLFSEYVLSQHLRLAGGQVIPWIDEDLDADTNEWIAKNMLIAKQKQVGRGNYYNHSGFSDPLITGLIGLRPEAGNTVVLHPLLPPNTWSYFAIDDLPYHGHRLTIFFDRNGKQYQRGAGFFLFVDGKQLASRSTLGPLKASLPPMGNIEQ
jgi:hypothetical protein